MTIRPDGVHKYLFRVEKRIDNLVPHCTRIRDEMRRELAEVLAAELELGSVSKREDAYSSVYRVEVFVIPPDELHRLIREEAMKLCSWLQWSQPVGEVKDDRPDRV